MPRLTNGAAVVRVSDETAARLGSEWKPAPDPSKKSEPKPKPTTNRPRKS